MNEPQIVKVDRIECPVCLTVQQAEVIWDERDVWPIKLHRCEKCSYIIMESEWVTVETVENKS
jgi:uncharacterized Fe-S center protein